MSFGHEHDQGQAESDPQQGNDSATSITIQIAQGEGGREANAGLLIVEARGDYAGMQIVGRFGDERMVLRASAAFEEVRSWRNIRPSL